MDPYASFYSQTESKHRRGQTTARARHKSSPVNRQNKKGGAKQREVIQVHDNNQAGANRVQTTRQERDPRQTINFRAGRDQTRNEIHRLGSRHK